MPRYNGGMSIHRSLRPGVQILSSCRFAVAGLLLWGGAGCAESTSTRAEAPPATAVPQEVEAGKPDSKVLPRRIPLVGTLFAAEEVVVSTRAAGLLRRTFVDVSDVVEPGAPLAQVETSDYEVAANQAQAALQETLARLGLEAVPDDTFDIEQVSSVRRSAAQRENARFYYHRLVQLDDGDVAKVARQEINDASTRLQVAEAEYEVARDEARALIAAARERQSLLQLARQRLANTLTVAPPLPTTLTPDSRDRWIVSQRLVTEGQYLGMAAPLYHLIVRNPLELHSRVPERYAAEVRLDQMVQVHVGGAVRAEGRISRISPMVDEVSRTFEIEATFSNHDDALKPGAFASGIIIADDATPSLCVPPQSILTSGGVSRLFVVEGDAARLRTIRTGRQMDDCVEVLSGLAADEVVVRRGAATLTDGALVSVRSAT